MIRVFIQGLPQPGGSKTAYPIRRRDGRIGVAVSDSNRRVGGWRSLVAAAAIEVMAGRQMMTGPLVVVMTFVVPRPKWHFGSGKNKGTLKSSSPMFPTAKPDVLKLARSTEDALTGIVWADDSQTVILTAQKAYSCEILKVGATIEIRKAD